MATHRRSDRSRPARRVEGHRRLARGARPRTRGRRRDRRAAARAAAPPRRSSRAPGLRVVLLEEGPLRSSRDFRMREREAYPDLYQESAAARPRDKAINILQGRCVGGGTTVNWTSSFRTPPATLACWEREYGLRDVVGRGDGAVVRAHGSAAGRRAVERRAQREQRGACARRCASSASLTPAIPRNVKGCCEPGLLRHGMPDQRQAVDAGHDHPRRARSRRDARHARARASLRVRGRPGRGARSALRWTRRHGADGAQGHRARAHLRRGGGRDRHARAAAAQRRARSARARRQAHVPASRRSCRPR